MISFRKGVAGIKINYPADAAALLNRFTRKRQEHFIVLTLNGAHEVISGYVVTIGLMNRTIVHPREVFWTAIKDNSAAVVLAHNHPSGRTEPSSEDNDVTRRLREAGDILGIQVLDHIIVGRRGYHSYLESDPSFGAALPRTSVAAGAR